MSDVKSLLTTNMNPQAELMAKTRGLQTKWDQTGLLEGLKGIEKAHMSILLENQAQQLLNEATATGTSANSEQWAGVALPLVRRVFAEISSKEFVSVQPMNLPSGLIFYLDFKYGSDKGVFSKDSSANYSSLFGGTGTKLGSTDSATGGLYGPGRFGYTINDKTTANVKATVASVAVTDWSSINFDANYSKSMADGALYKITTDSTNGLWSASLAEAGNHFDILAARSFTIQTGSAVGAVIPSLTSVVTTLTAGEARSEVVFIVSSSAAQAANLQSGTSHFTVHFTCQPDAANRGDFEDNAANGGGTDGTSAPSIGIPEVNLELKSEPIVAKARKLKAVWTPEMAQDLNAYHSIDAEAELTALLSEYVSMEIDLEILDMLITSAPTITTARWSAKINREISDSGVITDTTTAGTGGYYTKASWFQTLGNKIQKVSNTIHKLTLRGGANFLVCSPDVATVLESIPGYVVNTDGDSAKFAMGVSKVGSFASRFQVYKNPYMVENTILVGFRGNNFLETGAVYAPYIPLVQTPLVYDPVNFTPRRGVMTRYAKKMIRPEFYGKILVADLDQV
jgi:hypothetical protein